MFPSWILSLLKSEYVVTILAAFILLIPIAFSTGHLSFRLDTDYNVVLPMAQFAINAVIDPIHFLTWNPYIGLGIPVLGDPSSLALSPWYMPIFLLFGADLGLRVIIAVSIIVSGICMVRLLRSLDVHPRVIIWGAVLYELSGALAAMIASGHIERFMSYAVTPIAVLCMWKKRMQLSDLFMLGLLFTGMYLSDDFYTPWFLSLFWVGFSLFSCFVERKPLRSIFRELTLTAGIFIVFSLPKLIPFIRDVLPHFDRLSYINPFEGSVHGWLLPLFYVVPWQVSFYDRPVLQRLLLFRYNWYEYYAFISMFAMVPLLAIRQVLHNRYVRLSLCAVIIAFFYISVRYWYSPFHWIFEYIPLVRTFRVPQRIGVPLLVPLIALIAVCADMLMRNQKKYPARILLIIFSASSLWTGLVFYRTLLGTFETPRMAESYIASELRNRDSGNFYVANFVCCMQPFFLKEKIPVLNYYYGWQPNYVPKFTDSTRTTDDYTQFLNWRPTYIISRKGISFSYYGYFPYLERDAIQVWKTNYSNITPNL